MKRILKWKTQYRNNRNARQRFSFDLFPVNRIKKSMLQDFAPIKAKFWILPEQLFLMSLDNDNEVRRERTLVIKLSNSFERVSGGLRLLNLVLAFWKMAFMSESRMPDWWDKRETNVREFTRQHLMLLLFSRTILRRWSERQLKGMRKR